MYASSQYVNIIGISQKLMRTISIQAILVYLNPLNGILQSKVEKQYVPISFTSAWYFL
jgi:hypothetical protein